MTLKLLKESLNQFRTTNLNTKIFGLIGNPVAQSHGDTFHNAYFKTHGIDAIYFKWNLLLEDVPEAMDFFQHYVSGLSVTMPFKKLILSYVEKSSSLVKILGCANTLGRDHNKWIAENTDGPGMVQALKKIQSQKQSSLSIGILGCGSSATAIGYSLKNEGYTVYLFQRNHEQKIKTNICTPNTHPLFLCLQELNHFPTFDLDIIINTLPGGSSFSFLQLLNTEKKKKIVIDIVSNFENSDFLKHLHGKNHILFDRNLLFEEQAILQQNFWQENIKHS